MTQIEVDAKTAAKLLMVCDRLVGDIVHPDGRKGKLSDLIRYGVRGPTLTEVGNKLRATK